MRVLFISYYLPPLLYPQSIQIGRFLYYLKQYQDLEITVLTATEDSNDDTGLYPDIFDGIKTIKIKNNYNNYLNYIKNRWLSFFYQRPDVYVSWMNKAFKNVTDKYKKNDFDVILTFSYPLSTNILGKKLKNYFECKWIAHNSDPWVDNPHAHFKSYMKPFNEALEKECFTAANILLFTSKETKNFYQQKYSYMQKKIDYINHSFDPSLFSKPLKNNKKRIIRYIGSFYGGRTPKPLFDALNLLEQALYDQFIVELIGGGRKAQILLTAYSLPNVLIKRPVKYLESIRLMENSDLLLVIDAASETESIFFPSKLADYIGANKPIMGISPVGTTNRILNELGFECYDPEEITNIANTLKQFIENDSLQINIKDKNNYSIVNNIKSLKAFLDT